MQPQYDCRRNSNIHTMYNIQLPIAPTATISIVILQLVPSFLFSIYTKQLLLYLQAGSAMIFYNENITNSCGTAGDTASQQVKIQYTYMYKYICCQFQLMLETRGLCYMQHHGKCHSTIHVQYIIILLLFTVYNSFLT